MVDLTKGFFFCYNYPLPCSVQQNILQCVHSPTSTVSTVPTVSPVSTKPTNSTSGPTVSPVSTKPPNSTSGSTVSPDCSDSPSCAPLFDWNSLWESMFVWNSHWTREARALLASPWLVALIHGVVLQQRCIQSDRQFQLTLIARRSR